MSWSAEAPITKHHRLGGLTTDSESPTVAQWVKDPALPQLQCSPGWIPGPETSICRRCLKKKKNNTGVSEFFLGSAESPLPGLWTAAFWSHCCVACPLPPCGEAMLFCSSPS